MKKYVANTYMGVAAAMEADYATRCYAEAIGAEVVDLAKGQRLEADGQNVTFVNGVDLYYSH